MSSISIQTNTSHYIQLSEDLEQVAQAIFQIYKDSESKEVVGTHDEVNFMMEDILHQVEEFGERLSSIGSNLSTDLSDDAVASFYSFHSKYPALRAFSSVLMGNIAGAQSALRDAFSVDPSYGAIGLPDGNSDIFNSWFNEILKLAPKEFRDTVNDCVDVAYSMLKADFDSPSLFSAISEAGEESYSASDDDTFNADQDFTVVKLTQEIETVFNSLETRLTSDNPKNLLVLSQELYENFYRKLLPTKLKDVFTNKEYAEKFNLLVAKSVLLGSYLKDLKGGKKELSKLSKFKVETFCNANGVNYETLMKDLQNKYDFLN